MTIICYYDLLNLFYYCSAKTNVKTATGNRNVGAKADHRIQVIMSLAVAVNYL